jgi:hypothetical protein
MRFNELSLPSSQVTEGDLESLLATAESLQVKGLSNVRATRQSGQGQNSQAATLNPASSGKSSDHNSSRTQNGNERASSSSNGHSNPTSSISSSVPHVNSTQAGGRTQSSSSNASSTNHVRPLLQNDSSLGLRSILFGIQRLDLALNSGI